MDIQTKLGIMPNGRRWRKWAFWLVVVLAVGFGAAMLGKYRAAAAEAPMRYRTAEARIGDLTVLVTATGQLQPIKEVEVGSEVSGIIDAVLVDYNDYVKAGQVLARVNTEKLDAQMQQDKAQLETARAKVEDAKVTREETEKSYKRIVEARERSKGQLPSKQELDTSKAAFDRAKVAVVSAQAAVTQAEATLAMDQTNVSKAVIKSPVNGVVLTRKVEPGQTIAASFTTPTMFVLAEDLRKMKLQVNIDEADVGQVKMGQKVSFTVDAFPGRPFPGKITQLRYESTTTNNVVTYLAEISVDNHEMLLRPGMTATAGIRVQDVKNALLVPNVALRFTPSAVSKPADQRSWFRKFMPGPPPRSTKATTGEDDAAHVGSRVYVLRDQQPVAVAVKTGVTNGKVTEVLGGSIAAGVPLVIETLKAEL
ncbi:MAG: efflux RND transporter periplasmic adaptor subunit [Acidobacteriales bacterium]|nr:efflux RND transporter periplasmic adaptor subunit [Terriglobales bacterium]